LRDHTPRFSGQGERQFTAYNTARDATEYSSTRCVEVVWKFNRWHHQVDYSRFKNKLILKQGITKIMANNEYGMRLINAKESPVLGEESPAQNTMEICHTAPNT
jgi:hypothetical protein